MPAEISFVNGRAEAAFGLKPAWWDGTGQYVLDHYPNSDQMIRAAHLDWQVQTRRLFDDQGREVPGHFCTARSDTGVHLGVGLSGQYQVVQNREAFEFLDSLLMDGIMRYESAGALKGGRQVWALARMPSTDQIAEGDACARYVLWLNHHDGAGALYAIPTHVRMVCANTARVAVRGHQGIRHCGDVQAKLDIAKQVIAQADRQFTLHTEAARKLAGARYGRDDARQYIDSLIPPLGKGASGRSRSIRERKVETVRTALRSERNQLPAIRGTWWSLYSAVSEAVAHSNFYSFRGQGRSRFENKLASVMFGQGADFKQQAFELALDMAA